MNHTWTSSGRVPLSSLSARKCCSEFCLNLFPTNKFAWNIKWLNEGGAFSQSYGQEIFWKYSGAFQRGLQIISQRLDLYITLLATTTDWYSTPLKSQRHVVQKCWMVNSLPFGWLSSHWPTDESTDWGRNPVWSFIRISIVAKYRCHLWWWGQSNLGF